MKMSSMLRLSPAAIIVCAMTMFAVASLTTGCGGKGGDSAVVAKIGGDKITLKEFEDSIKAMPSYIQKRYSTPEAKKAYLERFVQERALLKEAERQKIAEKPEIKQQIEEYKRKLVTRTLLDKEIPKSFEISDAEVSKYFEENKKEFTSPEQVRVLEVVLTVPPNAAPDKDAEIKRKAEQLRSKVAGKNDDAFKKVAKENSMSPSKNQGGDLGYIDRVRFEPAFSDVAFATATGQVSPVFKAKGGWVFLKTVEKKASEAQEFVKVAAKIKNKLKPLRRKEYNDNYIAKIKKDLNIEVFPDVLTSGKPSKLDMKPEVAPAIPSEAAPTEGNPPPIQMIDPSKAE
jgi:peptidyl-prolyl cis-trans isomerase C